MSGNIISKLRLFNLVKFFLMCSLADKPLQYVTYKFFCKIYISVAVLFYFSKYLLFTISYYIKYFTCTLLWFLLVHIYELKTKYYKQQITKSLLSQNIQVILNISCNFVLNKQRNMELLHLQML